jgi:hypothetical protein
MTLKPHVACCRFSRNPTGEVHFTGRFNADGEPIVKSAPQKFLPGMVVLPTDEAELAHLMSLDALRPLTPDELTLYEAGLQSEFPPTILEAAIIERTRGA